MTTNLRHQRYSISSFISSLKIHLLCDPIP